MEVVFSSEIVNLQLAAKQYSFVRWLLDYLFFVPLVCLFVGWLVVG
jgi:hypothetical protein